MPKQADDLLVFSSSLLFAACEGRKVEKLRRNQPPEAHFWTKEIEHAKGIVGAIIEFAKNGQSLSITSGDENYEIVSGKITGQIQVYDHSIGVPYHYRWFGQEHDDIKTFNYPNEETKTLCHGEWATFGSAQMRMTKTKLLPNVGYKDGIASLTWKHPPQVRYGKKGLFGFFRWISTTSIREVIVTPDYGEIITGGIAGYALPRLIWKS